MGALEAQERQLSIKVQAEANEANSLPYIPNQLPWRRGFNWWLRMLIYTVFVLAGQAIATLLGRQYYDKGGKSNWLATLVQLCGFPIFLPYYCIPALNKNCPTTNSTIAIESKPRSILISPCINLCLSWLPYSSRLLLVFSRTILPSCIYFLPHFCIPTHLQCTFLLLPQLAEVNFFNCQLSFYTDHLIQPPSASSRPLCRLE